MTLQMPKPYRLGSMYSVACEVCREAGQAGRPSPAWHEKCALCTILTGPGHDTAIVRDGMCGSCSRRPENQEEPERPLTAVDFRRVRELELFRGGVPVEEIARRHGVSKRVVWRGIQVARHDRRLEPVIAGLIGAPE